MLPMLAGEIDPSRYVVRVPALSRYSVSTEVSIISVNSDSIIFRLDWLCHILLMRSIAFHKLGCKMTWRKAKYTKRISAEKRIDADLSRVVDILT
jgi:hypothetical protein